MRGQFAPSAGCAAGFVVMEGDAALCGIGGEQVELLHLDGLCVGQKKTAGT